VEVGDLVSSSWHDRNGWFGIIVDKVRYLDAQAKYVVMWGNGQTSSSAARELIPFTREMQ